MSDAINFMSLEPGTTVTLRDGSVVSIIENPRDGAWLICAPVDGQGSPDVVFLNDVMGCAK